MARKERLVYGKKKKIRCLSPFFFSTQAENIPKGFSKNGSFGLEAIPPAVMQIRKDLLSEIQNIITASKEAAIRSVNHHRVLMYWHIGQKIFEEEQQRKERAGYGDALIKSLAENLEPVYGSSFSFCQLNLFRQFYRTFPIVNALRSQFSWTHYRMLIRIDKEDKREFYIAETKKNNWTALQLEPQINTQLFERLLLSKYQLYLPSEKQLIEEVKKELQQIDQMNKEPKTEGLAASNTKLQTPNIS